MVQWQMNTCMLYKYIEKIMPVVQLGEQNPFAFLTGTEMCVYFVHVLGIAKGGID